ncbi:MAG: cytochrome c-type biogenesis protein CcmH [Chloroflexi bacterium]|nr:cytochrome c-type biogenesis protein CcmH [Chloroflexota bacterium]
MKKFNILLLLIILLSLFSIGTVAAQGGTEEISDDEVNAIASQLFCPVCENTPLDVCETQACKQWRELIRLQLSEGATEAEVKQYFVDNYGARVLSEPPREGFSLLVYFVPPVIILLGIFILFRAFKQWQKNDEDEADASTTEASPVSASETSDPEDDYLARFEEELRKKD